VSAARLAAVAICAPACAPAATAALRSFTNGFLSVEVQDAGAEAGMFTVRP